MPQLVALLHSFVGLAAVLVGFAGHLDPLIKTVGAEHTIKMVEIFLRYIYWCYYFHRITYRLW
jgi:NAD(P) transhydrogenase subunit beta